MNVKELILSQNTEELIKYMQDHFIAEYEDYDKLSKRYDKGFRLSIEDIKKTIPKNNSEELIYGMKCKEMHIDKTIEESIEHCNIKVSELLKMHSDVEIKTFDDFTKTKMPEHWSLMFIDWESILGYQVIETEFVSNLELAAEILWELTFFGYEKEINLENSKKEADELDKRTKEVKEAIEVGDNSKFITIDDEYFLNLEKKLGLYDGLTDEEIEKIRTEDKILRDKAFEKTKEFMFESKKKEYEFLKKLKKKYSPKKYVKQ